MKTLHTLLADRADRYLEILKTSFGVRALRITRLHIMEGLISNGGPDGSYPDNTPAVTRNLTYPLSKKEFPVN